MTPKSVVTRLSYNKEVIRTHSFHQSNTVEMFSYDAVFSVKIKDYVQLFLKNGPNPSSFGLFSFFSHDKYSINLTINDKSIDCLVGTRTRGSRMVGADESIELWRHSTCKFKSFNNFLISCH